jgi:hypothetical protein
MLALSQKVIYPLPACTNAGSFDDSQRDLELIGNFQFGSTEAARQ